jgi:hypothetical protein
MSVMRTLLRFAVVLPLVLGSLGAAPPDSLGSLGGHWRCAVAGGRPAERSYFPVTAKTGPAAGRRQVFGREDTTEPDGAPSTSFERMVENVGGDISIASVEGQGTAANATPLRFAGRAYDGDATMEIAYAISGDTMRRTAKRGAATVDDETCTREPEPQPIASCPRPDVPAQTLRTIEPTTPLEAYAAKVKGLVQVRVVLDDRSRVLWADVVSSASPLFNDVAVQAARGSTFRTATVNCRPVASEYIFSVDFE